MKKILILVLVSFGLTPVFSQNFHTLDTIYEIIEKSELVYEMHQLEEAINPKDRSDNLNFNNYFRTESEEGLKLNEYTISVEGQEYYEKAEDHFRNGEIEEARNMYLKVLESNPEYYRVITYVGQTYGIQKDWEKAKEWYQKVIDNNYIDYMAHWFLADVFKELGDKDAAVKEITIAQVLNRNNPRVAASLKNIYKMRKLEYDDWVFTPQMKVVHSKKNTIELYYDEAWIGYCLVKAVWEFEPGYREYMGAGEERYTIIEEKEAVINLYIGASLEKKNYKKQPFKALKKAIDSDMLDEFIIYEVMLLDYPSIAYNLPNELINIIADYVIRVRGGKKI